MGTWGPRSFSNDAALDWLGDLIDGEASLLSKALEDVLLAASDAALTDRICTAALAAAELVAAAQGHGDDRLNGEAALWLDAHREIARQVGADRARLAVERVYAKSELRELWHEAGPVPEWHADVRELLNRLGP